MLPTSFPVTGETFNYASIAVGIVFFGAFFSWFFPVIGARHWYVGPRRRLVPCMRPGKPKGEECIPMLPSVTHSRTAGNRKSDLGLQIYGDAP